MERLLVDAKEYVTRRMVKGDGGKSMFCNCYKVSQNFAKLLCNVDMFLQSILLVVCGEN